MLEDHRNRHDRFIFVDLMTFILSAVPKEVQYSLVISSFLYSVFNELRGYINEPLHCNVVSLLKKWYNERNVNSQEIGLIFFVLENS